MNRPFTIILTFFVIGIILSRIWLVQITIGFILIVFALLLIGMELVKKGTMVWIAMALVILGFYTYQSQFPAISMLGVYGEELPPVVIKVLKKPIILKNDGQVEVELLKLEGDYPREINEKALLKIPRDEANSIHPGGLIRLQEVKLIKEFNARDLKGYDLYLRGRGIRYEIFSRGKDIEVLSQKKNFTLLGFSHEIKAFSEVFLDNTLQEPQQEIMKSVLFGSQGYLSQEIREAFSKSGTAHIVAVSGLHIGIIVMMMEKLLKLVGVGRNKRLWGISGVIFIYGYIVGFPVSIVRAGAMYLLFVSSYFLHRRYDTINCLMLIAFFALLYNPLYLFSVAFQLSFGATLSILVFYPVLRSIPLKIPRTIKELLGVTLAAQLGTVPIIAYHFNEISLISLLVNLLIVPTLGILLSMGILSIMISLISPVFGAFINYFTNGLLTYIYWMVEISSQLPYSSIKVEKISGINIGLYYIILASVYFLALEGKNLLQKESWRKDELPEDLEQY